MPSFTARHTQTFTTAAMFKFVLIYVVARLVSAVSTERCMLWHGRVVCYPITTSTSSTTNTLVTDLGLFTIFVYPTVLCIFLGVLICYCYCPCSKPLARQRQSSALVAGLSRATEAHAAPSSSGFADQSNNNDLFTEVMVGPSIISRDPPPYNFQPDPSLPPPYEAVANGGFEELQICDGRTRDTIL